MMALRIPIYSRNILQYRCHHSTKLLNSFIPTKIIQIPNRFYSVRQVDPDKQKIRQAEAEKLSLLSTSEKNYFVSVYPEIIKSLKEDYMNPASDLKIPASRLIDVYNYNISQGKQLRCQFVVRVVQAFCSPKKLSDQDFHSACVLGWLLEMVYFVIMDDVLDESETRRGVPCWFRKEGIGLSAINDAHCIESCTYMLIKKYFENKPYYVKLMEIFREVTFLTIQGEALDLHHSKSIKNKDFSNLNSDTHFVLSHYKTGIYSLTFPFKVGMAMAGITDETIHKKVEEYALHTGVFVQVQDDSIDLYGDPEISGKLGKDIENGSFTWFLAKALELGSPEQKAIIAENYGIDDPNCVAKVKAVYNELHMPQVFAKFEEEKYQEIIKLIGNINIPYLTDMLTDTLNAIHKRKV